MEILYNLTTSKKVYEILNNDLIGIFTPMKLRSLEKNGIYWKQIQKQRELWENTTKLLDISAELFLVS